MIGFRIKNQILLLVYTPLSSWVTKKLKEDEGVSLKGTFDFLPEDLHSSEVDGSEEQVELVLGRLNGEYFEIQGRIFDITQKVFIHKSIRLSASFFTAEKNVSIFKKVSEFVKEDIYIGGDHGGTLPENEFLRLLKVFPSSYEIKRYVHARLGTVLSSYFDSASDIQEKYERYMNNRPTIKGDDLLGEFKEIELFKYEAILKKLEKMLQSENSYNEKQWQNEILDIILLLYPKYIFAFKEAPVRDTYNNKDRQLDFLLVDANGNVDIIEIKRPTDKRIVTEGKYRDNHIPLQELSGTVMQIEKYIFYLNKWGKRGEEKLTAKYKAGLPAKFKIKITNPSGMIIMGRDNNLSASQKSDFEVVKRKYKNVIDIITYDDLLRRLGAIVEMIKRR